MKTLKQLAVILTSLLILSACAGTPVKSNEKYNLDDQLEPVSEILRYNLMGWNVVDNQSFILQTAPSQFYLIVLAHPSDRLLFTETIAVSNTGAVVKPGFDKVTVFGPPYTDSFVIDKIYKLKDREGANAIKAQLTGK